MGKSTAQHLESMGLIRKCFSLFGKKPVFPWDLFMVQSLMLGRENSFTWISC